MGTAKQQNAAIWEIQTRSGGGAEANGEASTWLTVLHEAEDDANFSKQDGQK